MGDNMAKIKHEPLSLNHGLYLANRLMQEFYSPEPYCNIEFFWNESKDELIEALIKPQKWTIVHYWLDFYSDLLEEMNSVKKNLDDKEYFDILKDTLIDTDFLPNIPEPIFNDEKDCSSLFPCEDINCTLCQRIVAWEQHLYDNKDEINKRIVHSAFQIMFSNRRFMHDFNLEISKCIQADIDYLTEKYPEVVDKGKIKRCNYWPVWLKEALLYRDKGTCVLCRKNITGIYNISGELEVDHIIPLNLYGSNDSTNFQLLCKTCNASKQDFSSASNSINVPFWNI